MDPQLLSIDNVVTKFMINNRIPVDALTDANFFVYILFVLVHSQLCF